MTMLKKGWIVLVVLLLLAPAAMAQEGGGRSNGATPAVAEMGAAMPSDTIPAGKFAMLMRYGGGGGSAGGTFTFDQVPAGFNDSSDFGGSVGFTNAGGIDFIWFLTRSRGLMIGPSVERAKTTAVIEYKNEDDYGYALLHNKHITYTNSAILFHIGYRWLYGKRDQYASTLHLKFGAGGSDIMIDGVANTSAAWGGVAELGTSFYRRFDNGMFAGAQFDIRGSGASTDTLEFKALNSDVDVSVGGGGDLWSLVFGWECL